MLITTIIPLYKGNCFVEGKVKMIESAFRKAGILGKAELLFINDYPDEDIIIPETELNVRLITNEKNSGIQFSRVRGIRECESTFVHMLDQDDEIYEDFYLENLRYTEGKDVVVSNCVMELADGGERILYRNAIEKKNVLSPKAYIFLDCRIISPGQCLIRRDSVPNYWMENLLEANGTDDYLLWLLMFESRKAFSVNMTPLYVHKYTGENLSLNKEKMLRSHEELRDVLEKYPKSRYAKWIRSKVYFMKGENKEYAFLFRWLMNLRMLRIKKFEK